MSDKTTTQVVTGAPVKDVAGYAFVADLGTTRPVDGKAALATGYAGLGYLSDQGVTVTLDSQTEKRYDWGGDVIAVINKSQSATLKFQVAQRSATAMKYVWGDDAVVTDTADPEKVKAIHVRLDELPHKQLAFLLKNAQGPETIDIGDCQVTDIGDLKFVRDDLVTYDLTVELFRDTNRDFLVHWIG